MLNIESLNNVRDQKLLNKFEIYSKVLHKCHHRIQTVSKKGGGNCFYIIPEYIYGIPKYDTLNCANFIVSKLKKNGFGIVYTYPNLVYISWGHIPSQVKTNMKLTKPKPKPKPIVQPFRLIDDYRPSNNFLNKLKRFN